MTGLRKLGAPYTDEEIAQSAEAVKGKKEIDALIAYLQVLGTMVDVNAPAAQEHLAKEQGR